LRNKLSKIYEKTEEDPNDVIQSIKYILQMVARTLKEQDKVDLKNSQGKKNEDYELLLQKAECDIKRYIRVYCFWEI